MALWTIVLQTILWLEHSPAMLDRGFPLDWSVYWCGLEWVEQTEKADKLTKLPYLNQKVWVGLFIVPDKVKCSQT